MAKANSLGRGDVVRQNKAIPTGAVDGELMALDPKAGEVYGLDETGTRIWNAIGEGIRVDALIEKIVAAHEGDPEVITAETVAFLEELAETGIIVVGS